MTRLTRALLVVCLAAPVLPADTLTLRDALDLAGQLSPDVQTARLRILEREAESLITRSAYQPQVNAVVGGSYQTTNLQGIGVIFPGVPSRVGPYGLFNARPAVAQTVLDLSLLADIRAARARIEQARFDADTLRQTTQFTVGQLYLQALQADSRIKAAEARAGVAKESLQQVRDFEQAGTGSKLDIARAEQRYQTELTNAVQLRRERDVLLTMLLRTIGLDQKPLDLAPVSLNDPQANATRSELQANDARRNVLSLEQARAHRQRLPRIGFQADYGVLGASPVQNLSTYTVGGTLTIPLWTGGRIAAEEAAAAIRFRQADQERRAITLQIQQEVRQAEIERDRAREAEQAASAAAEAARSALELSRLRYGAGLATQLDVTTAQGVLTEAEDAAIRARYDVQLAQLRLARAQGDVTAALR